MPTGDTIAAIATGLAPAPRAIIRISGPGVPEVIRTVMIGMPTAERWAGFAGLRMGELRLPVRAVRWVAPASYTGEHALELHLPGNPALTRRVLEQVTRIPGVRHAQPGEFSARAYLGGRMSLAQAEAVAGVISASSHAMYLAAQDALRGRAGARYRAWSDELTGLLALVEAGIDFTDQEDVVAISRGDLHARVAGLASDLSRVLGVEAVEAATARARVVLAGAPSAGKSTLFNALLGRERSVVSPEPGTTRDAIIETLTLSEDASGPVTVELVDLAGVDDAPAGAIHEAAQALAAGHIRRAGVLVWCRSADATATATLPTPPDGGELLRVRTRADLATGASERGEISVCALDGRGLSELRRAIYRAVWQARIAPGGSGAVLPRHRDAIGRVLAHLRPLADGLADDQATAPAELTAESLRAALDELAVLTGRVEKDEIIGRVFASFCIGK